MSATTIKIKLLRALMFDGIRREAGEILALPAGEVADVVGGGRVELLDPADLPAVLEARQQVVRAMVRHAPRPTMPGPWLPFRQ